LSTATARDPQAVDEALPEGDDRLLTAALDVTDGKKDRQTATAEAERFSWIDVPVYNAGRGLPGTVEEASAHEVRSVFETSVFGLLAVTRAVLSVVRGQRSGRVFNISSVRGFAAGTRWGVYARVRSSPSRVSPRRCGPNSRVIDDYAASGTDPGAGVGQQPRPARRSLTTGTAMCPQPAAGRS
jgi:NAD(P)-dependent dehydrogenase (short-subunit alcohol dehydrogenase family)